MVEFFDSCKCDYKLTKLHVPYYIIYPVPYYTIYHVPHYTIYAVTRYIIYPLPYYIIYHVQHYTIYHVSHYILYPVPYHIIYPMHVQEVTPCYSFCCIRNGVKHFTDLEKLLFRHISSGTSITLIIFGITCTHFSIIYLR